MKKKIINIFMMMLIALSTFSPTLAAMAETKAPGDDPGVAINAPDEIRPGANVTLEVDIFASAGNLSENGSIQVKIPKKIVSDKTGQDIVNSTTLGSPFSFGSPALIDDGMGNWILNIDYDSNLINPTEAFSSTIFIQFKENPYYASGHPEGLPVDFDVTLNTMAGTISSALDTSVALPPPTGGRPHFQKNSRLRTATVNGINNVGIFDTVDPGKNVFFVMVNYDEQDLKNVKISDVIPEHTFLSDPDPYVHASGDPTIYDHFRIAKLTGFSPNTFEYVTSDFADKISLTPEGFTIDMGDINEGYVIMYGQSFDGSVSALDFGVKYNTATLSSDVDGTLTSAIPVALPTDEFFQASLSKSVSQSTIATNSGEIIYDLQLKVSQGMLPAGTVVSDPLEKNLSYLETPVLDPSYFSAPIYDAGTNTVSYTLLKDLNAGESTTIGLKTKYINPDAQQGDQIKNRASFNYSGTPIFSNTVVTTLEGSAYLYKIVIQEIL